MLHVKALQVSFGLQSVLHNISFGLKFAILFSNYNYFTSLLFIINNIIYILFFFNIKYI